MITTYIKYAFLAAGIALGVATITYVISNERTKTKLEMKNQTLEISNQTTTKDLSIQKEITKTYSNRVNQNPIIRKKVDNVSVDMKQLQQAADIQELDRVRSCELMNINNLEVVCQK